MSKSDLEAALNLHIRVNGLPEPVRELRFAAPRRWSFDFAWPDARLALEVEGGVYANGRHTTGAGFTADCEKYNEALLRGWRVLRVTGQQVHNGAALDWLRRALTAQGADPAPEGW